MAKYERFTDENGAHYYVNAATGEFISPAEGVYIETEEQRRQRQQYFEKIQKKKYFQEKYGSFVWNLYHISEETFPNLKAADITRLIYLATYTGYDGYLVGTNNKNLSKKQVKELMLLAERDFYNFWKTLVNNDIISETEYGILMNPSLFRKGAIGKKREDKVPAELYFIRIFVNGVRALYKQSTPASHHALGYLFRVIPYVNREYNVLCDNPTETEINKIKPLTIGEFCDRIGFLRKNSSRMAKYLLAPTFCVKEKGETVTRRAIHFVVTGQMSAETWKMYVNPKVFYAGHEWEAVEVLGAFQTNISVE